MQKSTALVSTHAAVGGRYIAGYHTADGYRLICDEQGKWCTFDTALHAQMAGDQRHMECRAWHAEYPLDPSY